jgi:hypothetical protein
MSAYLESVSWRDEEIGLVTERLQSAVRPDSILQCSQYRCAYRNNATAIAAHLDQLVCGTAVW